MNLIVFDKLKTLVESKVSPFIGRITNFYNNSTFLNIALKRKFNENVIAKFSREVFTDDVILENINYLLEIVKYCPKKLDFLLSSPIIYREALKTKDIELISKLHPEITEENLLLIDNFVTENLKFVKCHEPTGIFAYSCVLLTDYIKQGNFGKVNQFDKSLFTEEFIKINVKYFMAYLSDVVSVPNVIHCSQVLFNECLEQKKFYLLIRFDSSLFTEEFIHNNLDFILDNLEKYLNMPVVKNNLLKSTELFNECVKRRNFDLVCFFEKNAISDEILRNNLDFFMNGISTINLIPSGFIDSKILLNECVRQRRFDLVCQFDKSLITEDFIQNNIEFIISSLKEKIPEQFQKSQILFDELVKQKKFDLVCQCDSSFITEDFIQNNLEGIMDSIKSRGPSKFSGSQILFNECLKRNYFDLLIQFNPILFTEEFVQNNLEWIMSNIKDKLPWSFSFSPILLQECIKQNRFDLVCQFYSSLFTEELIQNNIEMIINNLKDEIPNVFIKSKVLFNECARQKRFDLLTKFGIDNFTEEFIQSNVEWVVGNIKDELPYKFRESQILFNECARQKRFDLLFQFDDSLFTEEFIQNNLELIMSNIKDDVPHEFRKSKVLFNECARQKKLDLLIKFDKSLFTEEFFQSNAEWVMSNINNYMPYMPYSFKSSRTLFNECVRQKRYDLLIQFDKSLITEEFIKVNLEWIMSCIKDKLPWVFKNSQTLFDEYDKQKNADLLEQFDDSLFTGKYIQKNYKWIISNLKNTIPLKCKDSLILFDECVRQKRFDLLIQFNESLFTEEFIKRNLEWVMSNINNYMPYSFKSSQILFNECVRQKRFDLLLQFDDSLFTEEFIKRNLEWIMENLNDTVPRVFDNSSVLLKELLSRKLDNLLIQMNYSLYTYDILEDNYSYFASLMKTDVVFNRFFQKILYFKKLALDNKDYELLTTFSFDYDLTFRQSNGELGFNQDKLKFYSDILGISIEELANKIKALLRINDEILNTMYPFMLSSKMNCLSFRNIEKLSIYPDIQMKLYYFKESELMVLNRILNFLDNDLDNSFDISTITYCIINNWSLHKELIATINSNELSNDELANLIFVLQRKNDFYNIKSMKDLEPSNFDKLTNEIFNDIQDKVLRGNISIDELRRAVFEKKYGLDLRSAWFINERYCQDMDIVNESSGLSERVRIILQSINYIFSIDSLEELSFIYLTATRMKNNFYSFIDLETQIRSEYAKKYSESLYRVKEEHLMKREDFETPGLYEKVCEVNYNGKKPKFYVLDGDFNLQIHVLGAYDGNWKKPDNFKEDWERPKIAYHGICTSYIGNNQIANARQKHPAYGFDSYEAEALIMIQNSDIGSNELNMQFAASRIEPCCFYPPKEMIDKTRHTHNELVLERRNDKNGSSFKRLPNYVVYMVDDINNENNFDMNMSPLFRETVQAAVDNDIPIVIVDRLKYAKTEKQKYEALLEKFEQQPNPIAMKDILLIVCDNMIGCEKYDTQPDMAYHTYFNQRVLTDVIDKIIEIIQKQPEKVCEMLIIELYKYSLKEPLIKDENKVKIEQLYNSLNLVNNNDIDKRKEVLRKIQEYYKMAPLDIREAINEDLNSGVTYQEVYDKILNSKYNCMKKI